MKLSRLLERVPVYNTYQDREVCFLTDDSRKVREGCVFICVKGARFDGHDAAKEAQAHLEDKINKLKLAISEAKIVDTSRLSTDSVQILSKVEMTNMANKAKMTYTIVSESEANLREGKISIKTPIAQGLLNKKVGDEVEIKIPRGTIKLRIDKITVE